MKADHPPLFVSPKLSASSFAMPPRPMKRSRSRSRDGQVDRPLKRVSLAPAKGTDVLLHRPVFHTILPVMDFSQQKSAIVPTEGYSMTPLWRLRPQGNTTVQPLLPHENQADDGDVGMDYDTMLRPLESPSVPPSPPGDPARSSSNPANAEWTSLRTPKPLTSCPSLEMSEIPSSPLQLPTPQTVRSSQPKRPRFTMGPRNDCEKCRAGVKGHWSHFV